ncbi:NEDD4-binding protein 1-like isoform X2 [Anopheles stephensi]|nr:NEDD4-binding protein 1-like isoform X2 [Anopheles stephensi]XP_035911940.1 NEDD4-binding protein 1-like isoform X2 [Anopheles stephensi]
MARNKSAKKASAAQKTRSITKMKANAIKLKRSTGTKKKSRKELAEQFKKMNGSPMRTRKQLREKQQGNPQQASSASAINTTNNNHQPKGSKANSSTEQKKLHKSATDTILIEDSDEENVANGNGQTPAPLFYLDRNPGIKEAEIPLYEVYHEIDSGPASSADRRPATNPEESVIIVLDSTIDRTVNDSMKEMQIEAKPVVGSSTDPVASSSATSSSSNKTTNVPKETESKSSASAVPPVATEVAEVIDLSDYSDTEPMFSNVQTSTPAFPSQNCIPLGFDVLKPQPTRNGGNQKPKAKNRWDKAVGQPVPAANQNVQQAAQGKKRMVIIDGNNVAFGHLNGKMFSVKGLDLCIRYFKKLGHEVTAVVPQFRLKKHQSTDYVLLEKLNRDGDITLAPCKSLPGQFSSSYDDRLILSVAEQFDGVIISNDNFRDLLEISPAWRRIIETRVIGYSWVKDCFFLPDDPYGRYGPTLQQILNGKSP